MTDYLTFDSETARDLALEALIRNNMGLQSILDAVVSTANIGKYLITLEIGRFSGRSDTFFSPFLNQTFIDVDAAIVFLDAIIILLEAKDFTAFHEEIVNGGETTLYLKLIWSPDLFPETFPGLQVWLKPNIGQEGNLTTWTDLTREIVFTGNNNPTIDTLTRGAALDGDLSDGYNAYLTADLSLGASPTLVAFYIIHAEADSQFGYGEYNTTVGAPVIRHFVDTGIIAFNQYPSGTTRSAVSDARTGRKVLCFYSSPTKSQIWANGTKLDEDTYSSSTSAVEKIRLGNLGTIPIYSMPGVIVSYLLYNQARTDDEIIDLSYFLMNLYGVSL